MFAMLHNCRSVLLPTKVIIDPIQLILTCYRFFSEINKYFLFLFN
uniref:Uncharacterized protein n=1 Tax=Lepeophtheirus salmonis TaxID=72036 RepID=A0A0K2UU20_LEPSM